MKISVVNIDDLPKPGAFTVGEIVEIYIGNHQGERAQGTVVAVLNLPGWLYPNYVVEVPTSIDPLLEVRCGFNMHRPLTP